MDGMLNPKSEKLEALVESLGGWKALEAPGFDLTEPIIAQFASVGVPERYIRLIIKARNTTPRDHAIRTAASGLLTLWYQQHRHISRSGRRRSWTSVFEEYWRCHVLLMATYKYTMEDVKNFMLETQEKYPGALDAWGSDICDELVELDGNTKKPSYLANIETRLQSVFRPPLNMQSSRRIAIRVKVNKIGSAEVMRVEESSGSKELDLLALSAIDSAFGTEVQPPCDKLSLRLVFVGNSVHCRPTHT